MPIVPTARVIRRSMERGREVRGGANGISLVGAVLAFGRIGARATIWAPTAELGPGEVTDRDITGVTSRSSGPNLGRVGSEI